MRSHYVVLAESFSVCNYTYLGNCSFSIRDDNLLFFLATPFLGIYKHRWYAQQFYCVKNSRNPKHKFAYVVYGHGNVVSSIYQWMKNKNGDRGENQFEFFHLHGSMHLCYSKKNSNVNNQANGWALISTV